METTPNDVARYLFTCLSPPADSTVGWAIHTAGQPHFEIDRVRSAGLGWALAPPGYLGHDVATSSIRSMLGIKTAARRAAAVLVNERETRGLAAAVRRSLDETEPR